ncbi:PAS domain-containing protein [Exilibacterium tricleocarpae]|uniref:histidine kinase n=1 Tax=Exilibacterium tricleocarpae TaxID=2591008 RepID=A0A545U3W6_9GAMM|nr:ATP-binding protein [Exilibacterium tricleocarpae]TQV84159.1 PAS domain-containing protein [Exilibacterium tricleocarpae]
MPQVARQQAEFEQDSGAPVPHPDSKQLSSAFQLFNEMSQQLAASYHLLEDRVAELTQELNTVAEQRLDELAEKERLAHRLESLLNVLPGGVIVIDAKGYITEANPAAYEMLGEPLEGLLWRDVISRCFAPRSDDGHEVSTRAGRRISIATRSLHRDGQIILLTDQTETRQLQAELSRHERLSALGKMVSALAHQIRTPLSAAMLYAGHLSGGQIASRQRRVFAKKLVQRLNHMERQVQDMLLFVKGELPLNDVLTLAALQRGLAEAMEVPMAASRSVCRWRVDGADRSIRCHREALIGALLNLVNNAIQAVGSDARLTIQFALQGERVVICVTDRGPGIDPQLLKTAQDLFVTTKAQGTGLGLAIVQTVARAHGGSFELRSQLQRGTRAMLTLPLAE